MSRSVLGKQTDRAGPISLKADLGSLIRSDNQFQGFLLTCEKKQTNG